MSIIYAYYTGVLRLTRRWTVCECIWFRLFNMCI